MSWGSTAYTPIIAYNEPPFGFAETITPPDFRTNNTDPWSSTDELKADLSAKFNQLEKLRNQENFECISVPTDQQSDKRINWWLWLLLAVLLYIVVTK